MPLAIMLGAPITATDFITKNLIPVTLGNTISGVIFVAVAFGFSYGSPEKTFRKWVEERIWNAVKGETGGKGGLPVVTAADSDGSFNDDSCHVGRQA